jgi:hypothetical protein
MNAKSSRKVTMGMSALEFSLAHPDASPGYTAAVTRLGELVNRAEQLVVEQHQGLQAVHAASTRKSELRRALNRAQLGHIALAGRIAAREAPELASKFVLPRQQSTYLAFRTLARGMLAEARAQKELLVKHGLAESVLDSLTQALDQFDEAMVQGTEGRRAHVGASAEMANVADEIVEVVKLIDRFNRFRFANDANTLAGWESASNVVTPTHPAATPAPGGEVRPAA